MLAQLWAGVCACVWVGVCACVRVCARVRVVFSVVDNGAGLGTVQRNDENVSYNYVIAPVGTRTAGRLQLGTCVFRKVRDGHATGTYPVSTITHVLLRYCQEVGALAGLKFRAGTCITRPGACVYDGELLAVYSGRGSARCLCPVRRSKGLCAVSCRGGAGIAASCTSIRGVSAERLTAAHQWWRHSGLEKYVWRTCYICICMCIYISVCVCEVAAAPNLESRGSDSEDTLPCRG